MNWYKCSQQQMLWGDDPELEYADKSKSDVAYWDKRYPLVENIIDGLSVTNDINNTSSISSSLENYYILPGIRKLPLSDFSFNQYVARDDIENSRQLANEIKTSKKISPLIIVVDNEGPYILEGGHRSEALNILGIKHFPALIVLDMEHINNNELV